MATLSATPTSPLRERDPQTEEEALEAMIRLVEGGRERAARESAIQWSQRFPASEKLRKWVDVLTPRPARTAPASGRDHRANNRWLRENAAMFPGNWMAVCRGELVAIDPSLSVVRAKIAQSGVPSEETLLWCQPRERPQ